jgi:hypothetical protein
MASEQHLVDEADDRRVFDVVAADGVLFQILVAAGDVEVLEVQVVVRERRHLRVDLLDGLAADALQLVLFDDHRLDRQSRLELDLIERMQVGRIRNRDEQPLAALDQRQQPMLWRAACRKRV